MLWDHLALAPKPCLVVPEHCSHVPEHCSHVPEHCSHDGSESRAIQLSSCRESLLSWRLTVTNMTNGL